MPKNWFTYYFAVSQGDLKLMMKAGLKTDVLISFAMAVKNPAKQMPAETLASLRKAGKRVMLDSGAFTNYRAPGTVKLAQYLEYIKSEHTKFDEYITFDDLRSRKKTIENWLLLKKHGLKPLFVDHLWMKDSGELLKIWKGEPKLCLSMWAKTAPGAQPFPSTPKGEFQKKGEHGRKVNTRTHLLACGSLFRVLDQADVIDSVDSAAWDRAVAFGKILVCEQREVREKKIPIIQGYDLPKKFLRRDGTRPPSKEVLGKLEAFRDKYWKGLPVDTQYLHMFNVHQLDQYQRELNAIDDRELAALFQKHKAEKQEAGTTSTFFVEWDDEPWLEDTEDSAMCENLEQSVCSISEPVKKEEEQKKPEAGDKNWFTYYFAVGPSHVKAFDDHGMKVDFLISFAEVVKNPAKNMPVDLIKRWRADGRKVMLDSGAFTNYVRPGTVSFEQYREYIKSEHAHFNEYVTFDDLRKRANTIKNWEALRGDGLKPLFVDHLWMKDEAFVDDVWKKEPKLCLSMWAKTSSHQDRFPATPKNRFPDRADKGRQDKTRCHLLACGSLTRLFPQADVIDSVDSASWGRARGFGKLLVCETRDVGSLKMPVLVGYDLLGGYARSVKRPLGKEGKAKFRAFMSKVGWKGKIMTKLLDLFNVDQIFEYQRLLNAIPDKAIVQAAADHLKAKQAAKKSMGYFELPWHDDPLLLEEDLTLFEDSTTSEVIAKAEELQLDLVIAEAEQLLGVDNDPVVTAARQALEEIEKQEVPPPSASTEEKRQAQAARSKRYGVEALDGKGERLTFPAGYPRDLKMYGDPVNLMYPLDPAGRARNARARFKQFATEGYEKEESRRIVHTRIIERLLELGASPSFDENDPLDKLLSSSLKERLQKQATTVQTIILSKERFKSLDDAKAWIKEHNFKAEHEGKGADETSSSFRFRQADPGAFEDGSFRTIDLAPGVKAVIGRLKEKKEKKLSPAQQAECDAETEQIRENKKKPEAKQKHKFKPAKFTHPNGHPRCLICGDEESTSGVCNSSEKEGPPTSLDKVCSPLDEEGEIQIKLLPVDKADVDKQIVFGIVLEPGEVDSQEDTVPDDEIETAAHVWLARFQDRGLMHEQIVNSKIEIYESYIAPANWTIGGQRVKKGSWLLMYHVLDDALWKDIKSGKLTGFSMGGFARRRPT